MHRLRSLLPSANCLFVFEAAARRRSFTGAAEELNVSQPAVSKTIKALETATGLQLFRRVHTRLELTAEGLRFYNETVQAFDRLHLVLASLRTKHSKDTVRVSFSASFIQLWLLPRLSDFKRKHPEVLLRIEESSRDNQDLETENIDVSARLGSGKWPGLQSWHFVTEEVIPVCSPSYMNDHGTIVSPRDLLNHPLLHVEERHRARLGWQEWFRHSNVIPTNLPMEYVFTDNLSTIEAATHGQGVALAWKHLASDYLQRGRLICPLQTVYRSGDAIHLIMPENRLAENGAALFRDWLLSQDADAPIRLDGPAL